MPGPSSAAAIMDTQRRCPARSSLPQASSPRLACSRSRSLAKRRKTRRPRPRRGSSTRRTASSAPLRPRSGASGPPPRPSTHPSPPRWRWRALARLAAEQQRGAPTERHGARLAPPADASRRQHHRAYAADAQERAECGHRLASCTRCRRRLTGERLAAARRTGLARHAATWRPRPRRGSSTRRAASSALLRPRSGASGLPPRPSPAHIRRHPDGDGVPRHG